MRQSTTRPHFALEQQSLQRTIRRITARSSTLPTRVRAMTGASATLMTIRSSTSARFITMGSTGVTNSFCEHGSCFDERLLGANYVGVFVL